MKGPVQTMLFVYHPRFQDCLQGTMSLYMANSWATLPNMVITHHLYARHHCAPILGALFDDLWHPTHGNLLATTCTDLTWHPWVFIYVHQRNGHGTGIYTSYSTPVSLGTLFSKIPIPMTYSFHIWGEQGWSERYSAKLLWAMWVQGGFCCKAHLTILREIMRSIPTPTPQLSTYIPNSSLFLGRSLENFLSNESLRVEEGGRQAISISIIWKVIGKVTHYLDQWERCFRRKELSHNGHDFLNNGFAWHQSTILPEHSGTVCYLTAKLQQIFMIPSSSVD